jgi:putative transposase
LTVTDDQRDLHPLGGRPGGEPGAARAAINEMLDAGLLDDVMARADAGELRLTGEGGFLPEMIKAVLERGLAAELTGHLGYEKGDPAGRGLSNSRNGSTPKTLASEVGEIPLAVPRDRQGSFEPRLVPKGARRAGGLDDMIISLYAGGMTVRDIQHHLARTLGTELSHDTISTITDAVLEEVKAWQTRPLEEIYPIIYLDALVVKVRALSLIL